MDKIVLTISRVQLVISNVAWVLFDIVISITITLFMFSGPVLVALGVALFMLINGIIFNRGMRKIIEIVVDDDKILLTYYKLWVKKSIAITRNTFTKLRVEKRKNELSIYIYDKRFVSPPCMYVQYSENKFDHLANNICESREDIERAIALFEKYNYRIEYENK